MLRLDQTGAAGFARINFSECDPSRLRRACWPQLHQSFDGGNPLLMPLAVFAVQQSQVVGQILESDGGPFHGFSVSNRYTIRELRGALLDLREEPALRRRLLAAVPGADLLHRPDEKLRPENLVKRGKKLWLGKSDDFLHQIRGWKVWMEHHRITNKLFTLAASGTARLSLRVAFLQRSVFGWNRLTFRGVTLSWHRWATSFGLGAESALFLKNGADSPAYTPLFLCQLVISC